MIWTDYLKQIIIVIQHGISFCGILIITMGIIAALVRYLNFVLFDDGTSTLTINKIRLSLGRVLTLGLEFIVAADLISTTTTPDYYSVGIVAIIVLIRTLLSYSLNREINEISRIEKQN